MSLFLLCSCCLNFPGPWGTAAGLWPLGTYYSSLSPSLDLGVCTGPPHQAGRNSSSSSCLFLDLCSVVVTPCLPFLPTMVPHNHTSDGYDLQCFKSKCDDPGELGRS